MTTDLGDFIESMKRRVIAPGSDVFNNVTDTEWLDRMTDGFWEARLDGFVQGYSANEDGIVDPEMPRDLVALTILYAAIAVMQTQVLNTQTRFSAEAGPVSITTETSPTLYREMLDSFLGQRKRLLDELDEELDTTPVYITDALSTRRHSSLSYNGVDVWHASVIEGLWSDLELI